MLVADLGGPTMFARIGVVRALNRHREPVAKPARSERRRTGLRGHLAGALRQFGKFVRVERWRRLARL